MKKYEPLREYLAARQHLPRVRMTFAEVAKAIGEPLPASAFNHAAWWANQTDTTHRGHAAAWLQAGFKVDSFHQEPTSGWVVFVRL
jgi:hypothetical protein